MASWHKPSCPGILQPTMKALLAVFSRYKAADSGQLNRVLPGALKSDLKLIPSLLQIYMPGT